MAKSKNMYPPFVNPATGGRYDNWDAQVGNTGKPAHQLTFDEFMAELGKMKGDQIYAYFCALGWPEGANYMQDRKYAERTGWPVVISQSQARAERRLQEGEGVSTTVRAPLPEVLNALVNFSNDVMECTKKANFAKSCKTAIKQERASAKKLLALLLGRKPEDKEIDAIIPG